MNIRCFVLANSIVWMRPAMLILQAITGGEICHHRKNLYFRLYLCLICSFFSETVAVTLKIAIWWIFIWGVMFAEGIATPQYRAFLLTHFMFKHFQDIYGSMSIFVLSQLCTWVMEEAFMLVCYDFSLHVESGCNWSFFSLFTTGSAMNNTGGTVYAPVNVLECEMCDNNSTLRLVVQKTEVYILLLLIKLYNKWLIFYIFVA